MSQAQGDERTVSFGRLSMRGHPLNAAGSWMVTEEHGDRLTSFIVMDTAQARKLRDQIDERLSEEPE